MFLESVRNNDDIDFIFVSDHDPGLDTTLHAHAKWLKTDLAGLRKRISSALGVSVSLSSAYKICDYRPMFGDIFAAELQGYEFWGHCDLDLVFGKITNFITDSVLENYKKILVRGNFSIYRNIKDINSLWRTEIPGPHWRNVVSSNKSFLFDEWPGIYKIFVRKGIDVFMPEIILDIRKDRFDLRRTIEDNVYPQVMYYEDGRIYRLRAGDAQAEEYLLIHLQKRMLDQADFLPSEMERIYFTPTGFLAASREPITPSRMKTINGKSMIGDLWILSLRLKKKLRKALNWFNLANWQSAIIPRRTKDDDKRSRNSARSATAASTSFTAYKRELSVSASVPGEVGAFRFTGAPESNVGRGFEHRDEALISIAICIASFNRRERTLGCLERVFAADLPRNAKLVVYLLDDASPDGTAAAIAVRFPQVRLHQGDGNCFWAGGMRVVFAAAREDQHDFYIWLNDDVTLFRDTILRALEAYNDLKGRLGGEHVIIGAMSGSDGLRTYSGFQRASRWLPWKFIPVDPLPDTCRECVTTNGNFIFFSAATSKRVGNIHSSFIQMHADIVFGLLARKTGARLWLLPRFAGICEANIVGRKNWKAPGLSLVERLRIMEHPLGYPLRPSMAYARNFGIWAPVMIAAPYLSLLRAHIKGLFAISHRATPK